MELGKTVNYTPEQTAQVLQLYAEGVSLEDMSKTLQKSKHSIVAKLCREGVYKTQPQEAKRMKKADMISRLESVLELPEGSLSTIEKGSHEALTLLLKAVDLVE
jgi:hypothetical protein